MKKKVRARIVIPVGIAIVLIAAVMLVVSVTLFSDNVNQEIRTSLRTASRAIANDIEEYKDAAHTAAVYIAADPEITRAVSSGDRKALLDQAKLMQNATGMEFCTITDPKGSVVLRTHEPNNYGDSIAAQANVQSAMNGQSLAATEEGSAVRMSVRAGAPIFGEQGEIVGVVSVGFRLDTNTFVDASKAIYGTEVTVFQGDERIATTVMNADETRAVGTKAMAEVSQTVLAGEDYVGEAKVLDQAALVQYTPIHDAEGKTIGMLFVGRYLTTERNAVIWNFVLTNGGVALAMMVAVVIVLWLIVNGITKPLVVMSNFFREVGSTGNITVGAVEQASIQGLMKRQDEIATLSQSFVCLFERLGAVSAALESVAENDLTVDIEPLSDKDTLGKSVQHLLVNFNGTLAEIRSSSSQVSTSSSQIAAGAQTLAQGATEQAAAAEELSSSVAEINNLAHNNSQVAEEALQEAEEADRLMAVCMEQVSQMLAAMQKIDDKSKTISKTTAVMDSIARQTNLLALNAAVESARAGVHGKGFAVVSEEVRSLASKSADSAKEASSLVDENLVSVAEGKQIAAALSETMQAVLKIEQKNASSIAVLRDASLQQSDATEQIHIGVDQIAQVVQQNSAVAEESAAAAQELSGQSDMLNQEVARFKLEAK